MEGGETLLLQGGWKSLGAVQIQYRFPFGTKKYAGIGGGEEPALPEGGASAGAASCVEYDVAGEVAGLAAQPVADPRTHRGHAEARYSALHLELAGVVVEFFRVHRAHHQDVIRDGTKVRDEVAEFHAGLSVFPESPLGSHEGGRGRFDECETGLVENAFGETLTGHFIQFGLGVEEIDLGRSPCHEDEDAGLGLGIKVRLAGAIGFWKPVVDGVANKPSSARREARATPPSPEADVARKSLRVRNRWFSIVFMAIRAILW